MYTKATRRKRKRKTSASSYIRSRTIDDRTSGGNHYDHHYHLHTSFSSLFSHISSLGANQNRHFTSFVSECFRATFPDRHVHLSLSQSLLCLISRVDRRSRFSSWIINETTTLNSSTMTVEDKCHPCINAPDTSIANGPVRYALRWPYSCSERSLCL